MILFWWFNLTIGSTSPRFGRGIGWLGHHSETLESYAFEIHRFSLMRRHELYNSFCKNSCATSATQYLINKKWLGVVRDILLKMCYFNVLTSGFGIIVKWCPDNVFYDFYGLFRQKDMTSCKESTVIRHFTVGDESQSKRFSSKTCFRMFRKKIRLSPGKQQPHPAVDTFSRLLSDCWCLGGVVTTFSCSIARGACGKAQEKPGSLQKVGFLVHGFFRKASLDRWLSARNKTRAEIGMCYIIRASWCR